MQESPILKPLLIVCGSISVGLGVIGIVVPLLPTTPFLLLAAACYIRSSDRFYNWLINSKYLGAYIRNYRENKAMDIRLKILLIVLLWAAILFSAFNVLEASFYRIILIIIAISVSVHILLLRSVKFGRKRKKQSNNLE